MLRTFLNNLDLNLTIHSTPYSSCISKQVEIAYSGDYKIKNAKLLAKDKACITVTNQLKSNRISVNIYADKIINILGDYS